MTVRLHPRARVELRQAVAWYEERRPGLGETLAAEVEHAVETIRAQPKAWPSWPAAPRARRYLLSRFPFALVYVVAGEALVIIALAHTSRPPDYWLDRLGEVVRGRPRRRR